jgi:putative iron-dependent peroxidase
MAGWNALPTEVQERIIGRTKSANIELGPAVKPSSAHNALTVIVDADGQEVKIVRANMPFGQPGQGEFGTYFIGYAKSPGTTEQMLENMFIGRPPGNYDRLLDFSHPVTGCLFFVPSISLLDGLATASPDPAPETAPETPAADAAPTSSPARDGSLAIGSLKGNPQ